MFICVPILVVSVLVFSYFWIKTHWKRRHLNCLNLNCNEHLGFYYKRLYDLAKARGLKHVGTYTRLSPMYIPNDLKIIKDILSSDFECFPQRGYYFNEVQDPLSAHVFNLSGEKWKRLRRVLGPIFTPSGMRDIYPTLLKCQDKLLKVLELLEQSKDVVDVKNIADEFVFDVICCCAFGLAPDENNSKFKNFGRRILKRSITRQLKGFVVEQFPKLGQLLDICLIPKDVSHFFINSIEDKLNQTDREGSKHNFLQTLAHINLTTTEIASQCFIFFLAGFTTSPALITFALYELALHQDLQNRTRDEILAVSANQLTYDCLQNLKYLDQVVDETLRKYPPASYLTRQCAKTYQIPGSRVIIDTGTIVQIPVLGIHYDEEYYPEPNKFDPERFSQENRKTRDRFTHIPFGDGPRKCLGMSFGLLQTKLCLASMLQRYKFSVNSKTEEPLVMMASTLVLTAKGGIWLDVQKLNTCNYTD